MGTYQRTKHMLIFGFDYNLQLELKKSSHPTQDLYVDGQAMLLHLSFRKDIYLAQITCLDSSACIPKYESICTITKNTASSHLRTGVDGGLSFFSFVSVTMKRRRVNLYAND